MIWSDGSRFIPRDFLYYCISILQPLEIVAVHGISESLDNTGAVGELGCVVMTG